MNSKLHFASLQVLALVASCKIPLHCVFFLSQNHQYLLTAVTYRESEPFRKSNIPANISNRQGCEHKA